MSNPRTLCVEFASYDDMAVAQALSEETEPIPRKAEPLKVDHSVEGWIADQARINDRTQRRVNILFLNFLFSFAVSYINF